MAKPRVTNRTHAGSKNKTAGESIIVLSPDEKFGPAMSRLTDARKKFVKAYVLCPGRPQAEYAKMAGMGGTHGSQRTAAQDLLHDETVVEAIKEYTYLSFGNVVPLVHKKLADLLESDEPKVVLDTCKVILQHAGMVVAGTHNTLTVRHEIETMSTKDLEEAMRKFVAELPAPPKVGYANAEGTLGEIIVDVDYSEVKEAA